MSEKYSVTIEPEEALVAVPPPEMQPPPLARALPESFPLLTLLMFVPDPKLKQQAEALAAEAMAIKVEGQGAEAVTEASAALVPLRAHLKHVREDRFKIPKGLAFELHRRISGLEKDFCAAGDKAVETQTAAVLKEQRRLDRVAQEAADRAQAEADKLARAAAKKAAAAAKKDGAPKEVVQALKEQAKTGTAPPVAVPAGSTGTLVGMTTVTRWKARFKGTSPTAEPNPDMDELIEKQQEQVRRLMAAVARGEEDLVLFDINWAEINRRAHADKTTFSLPELEAYDASTGRSK